VCLLVAVDTMGAMDGVYDRLGPNSHEVSQKKLMDTWSLEMTLQLVLVSSLFVHPSAASYPHGLDMLA
jgi:hypothetical protein